MRKIINIIFACILLVSLNSCLFQEENIFSESAAKRMNDALDNDFKLLTSAPNGWVLDYFPTVEQEGYTFLMYFDESGYARIAAKNRWFNNRYTQDTCLFRIIADNGPVLTFDTYNKVLHFFSNPEDLPQTDASNDPANDEGGRGLEGDYEFIIMEPETDNILLKGKKRGVFMPMRRLAENQDWTDYFKLLDEMNVALFVNGPQLQLTCNDSLFTLTGGASHIFKLVPNDGDPIADGVDVPFIVTDYGIRFVKPFEINDLSVQTFKLSDDKNSLICTNSNVDAKILGPNSADFFFHVLNSNKNMAIMEGDENMSPSVSTLYNTIKTSVESGGRTLNMISFSYHKTWKHSLLIRTSRGMSNADGFISFTIEKESANEISLSFNGFTGTFDPNGKRYYDNYNGISDLIDLLNGKFTTTIAENQLNPKNLKFTNVSNPNIWFNLLVK
ncbi:MAG: DUF4302 domain-containing protein [Dysgonamonadaceae bacterium]|jgi:hypothetical protein|nr:DUF4302 domain-containing protein [Dysgonamonadaceae bacterium]